MPSYCCLCKLNAFVHLFVLIALNKYYTFAYYLLNENINPIALRTTTAVLYWEKCLCEFRFSWLSIVLLCSAHLHRRSFPDRLSGISSIPDIIFDCLSPNHILLFVRYKFQNFFSFPLNSTRSIASGLLSNLRGKPDSVLLQWRHKMAFSCLLLGHLGSTCGRIVFKHVYNHLLTNSLIYKYQSGFLPEHSTVHQPIEAIRYTCLALENHEINCQIYGDISKTFDRVWRRGLRLKLEHNGIKGDLLEWFNH